MTELMLFWLAIAVIALVLAALRDILHDGPARQGPPRSHYEDPRFRSPGAWS
jgi:hypothetical protein